MWMHLFSGKKKMQADPDVTSQCRLYSDTQMVDGRTRARLRGTMYDGPPPDGEAGLSSEAEESDADSGSEASLAEED